MKKRKEPLNGRRSQRRNPLKSAFVNGIGREENTTYYQDRVEHRVNWSIPAARLRVTLRSYISIASWREGTEGGGDTVRYITVLHG